MDRLEGVLASLFYYVDVVGPGFLFWGARVVVHCGRGWALVVVVERSGVVPVRVVVVVAVVVDALEAVDNSPLFSDLGLDVGVVVVHELHEFSHGPHFGR